MNVRIAVGLVLVGVAILIYGVSAPKVNKEADALEKAILNQDNLKIVEGIVDSSNFLVENFLVIASKEEFTGAGKHNGFKSVEKKLQDITVKTPKGKEILVFDKVPWRGEDVAHILLDEKTSSNAPIQWLGLRQGARIIAVGQPEHDKLNVQYAYAGDLSDYLNLLEEGQKILNIVCGIIALIGFPLLIWGFVRK
ncbi:hypothetical protein KMW28_14150 [Flammeovirga yaeyamensis]|uniref:Single cache domain-containing protein n=1 Tax=Flammeovirga yaeyamensis TaxID=367791 RepID=A0AAX1MZP3_9BACT|nr:MULTISPECIES: hypothetical protein [Flammeovirga]ANQ47803.1 hypothetical protein MY04_0421 [Flammeovirga sp. MY04]MBB3700272.1 lipopolysaccharide export LptBFGC system permease protein LptF [Flammeovirga yaeyamensis]NMF37102.1 hypothetical protein [Flammeovirga yaeyamensis]QWG00793.1 hypothetical protein KMW28_14150 [Flammeovirga yaeyamensis]